MDALSLQANIDAYFNAIPKDAWPDWVIGGHDKPRIASKIGQEQARVLTMLLMTLKGTPFLFAGDNWGWSRYPSHRNAFRTPLKSSSAAMDSIGILNEVPCVGMAHRPVVYVR